MKMARKKTCPDMADVRITVHGQKYSIRCDEGEEARVEELAAYFNTHVERLARELGHVAESRLLILAGITICEELFAARAEGEGSFDRALAEDLARLAGRIERCAEGLESGLADGLGDTDKDNPSAP